MLAILVSAEGYVTAQPRLNRQGIAEVILNPPLQNVTVIWIS